ncbi:uncharacterized protein PHALS_02291 [Plasmopara halstedii]|uniref:Uncharacterized protein n=1 Tax=Plasmopara halstedii TaxID=4781 RepID=A0A0P1AWW4_PLAHL|nr:uncharacterized protein PHALS_02291 [Plasmopara halstedii]CEG45959.1 hypothetical protein PHALS_02291 [Plasmopara halstedii]|eukprot:XP_024582328.1 hypothetical protein PHALS_02291 [Plasmopara halstedii]
MIVSKEVGNGISEARGGNIPTMDAETYYSDCGFKIVTLLENAGHCGVRWPTTLRQRLYQRQKSWKLSKVCEIKMRNSGYNPL